jgi:F-type H+-transporting ATPase subunit epsilon
MIELDLVTPSRRIVVGAKVSSVRLPAADGEIQILPGHTELVTLLGTGVMEFAEGERERKFALSYGFAEIRNDKVIVLAETCEESAEIDRQRAKEAQKRAEALVLTATSEAEIRKQELKRRRSLVRQSIAQ